ncbi:hypothetical protein ACTJK4_17370 [Ralstonia sp. 22111]|uniref:hypothetical protein n=1 Tax=Ralstonia sp. 22111 TaxID=3453878 RepID=UPI003F83B85E
MSLLSAHTDTADRALAMPLWALSMVGRADLRSVMSWRHAIEKVGAYIPPRPTRAQSSIRKYVNALRRPPRPFDASFWAALNVMLFCLRLAEAKGDLSHYVLTYETLMADEWGPPFFIGDMASRDAWCNLRRFYDEWFSTLKISVRTQADWRGLLHELEAHGLHYEVMATTRACDERYALANSLVPAIEPGESDELQIILVRRNNQPNEQVNTA